MTAELCDVVFCDNASARRVTAKEFVRLRLKLSAKDILHTISFDVSLNVSVRRFLIKVSHSLCEITLHTYK